MNRKARIYKIKNPARGPRRVGPWVSILPSGTFGLFHTWAEALEYQGATLVGSDD